MRTMAKRKNTKSQNNDRYKVNFNSEKTKSIITTLMIAEDRITRDEIISIGNKDIYYKLSKSGYITESSKDIYKGTQKLKNYVKQKDGKSFSSSGSASHSQAVRNTLKFVPSSVLSRKSFNTGTDIEKDFKKIQQSERYKENLEKIKDDLQQEWYQIEKAYQESLQYSRDEIDRYMSKMQYLQDRDRVSARQSWLEQEPLTPDYQLTFREDELNSYIENLKSYRDSLDEDSKAYSIYSQSIEKLENLTFNGEITINIEVITDSYQNREIFLHEVYEQTTSQPQIFLC